MKLDFKPKLLTYKVIIILSILTGIVFGVQRMAAGWLDVMMASTPMVCPTTGYREHENAVQVVVTCGTTQLPLNGQSSLAVLTKGVTAAKCAVYRGERFGDQEWRCSVD